MVCLHSWLHHRARCHSARELHTIRMWASILAALLYVTIHPIILLSIPPGWLIWVPMLCKLSLVQMGTILTKTLERAPTPTLWWQAFKVLFHKTMRYTGLYVNHLWYYAYLFCTGENEERTGRKTSGIGGKNNIIFVIWKPFPPARLTYHMYCSA